MGIGKRVREEDVGEKEKKDLIPANPAYTLDDLVLSQATRSSLLDFLALKEHYDNVFEGWGLSETHKSHRQTSVNFYGLPGTGKSMAAHVVASEMKKPLILVNYAEIESKYVGETSKNIAALFELAVNQDAIIFFDEADAMLSRRVTSMSSSTDVSVNQTRSVLLTLLDRHRGLVIFATNFLENYDPAFMRRILAHIHFSLPDEEARQLLWKKYIPLKMPVNLDAGLLSVASEGLSGAEISSCVIKAALSASRQGKNVVEMDDFIKVISEVMESKSVNAGGSESKIDIRARIVGEEYVRSRKGSNYIEEMMK